MSWRRATDHSGLEDRIAAAPVAPRIAATWILERHAWFVADAALRGLLTRGAMPPLDALWMREGADGLAEAVRVPAGGWAPASGGELGTRVRDHVAPLVRALSPFRPPRPLWRSVGDRIGQAALLCEDPASACALAGDALAVLGQPGFSDGPARRRTGCCLAHCCPGLERCEDCPVSRR